MHRRTSALVFALLSVFVSILALCGLYAFVVERADSLPISFNLLALGAAMLLLARKLARVDGS